MIRAILIDVVARDVREIELPTGDQRQLAAMQTAVGGYIELALRLPSGDVLFVDEEALIKPEPPPGWFALAGRTFAGNGLVAGTRGDDTVAAKTELAALKAAVRWLGPLG